jgi:hypothetical protein
VSHSLVTTFTFLNLSGDSPHSSYTASQQTLLPTMPGVIGKKMGQKVDLDFTLRKVFGKETFRYILSMLPSRGLN